MEIGLDRAGYFGEFFRQTMRSVYRKDWYRLSEK